MKWNDTQLEQLCRSLGLLLHGGIPVSEGCFLLAQEEGLDREALEALGTGLEAGELFSELLAQRPFPRELAGLVRIAEATGRMEETLLSLADRYAQRSRIRQQLRQALAYPCGIAVLALGVLLVLLIRVLPVFDGVYASLGTGLTGPGLALLVLGRYLKAALPGLGLLAAVVAVLILFAVKYPPARETLGRWYLSRFGDRGIARKFANARFASALAMGIGSGLTAEEALSLARELLAENPGAAARCVQAERAVEAGMDLAKALGESALLPPARSRMLSVGLRGGNADQVMADIAKRMEEDANASLEALVGRIEPAMVLGCALLLGLILLSVMLPLIEILGAIG